MGKKKVGRPTVMTEETLNKLEYVFGLGGTDEEACFFADISHQTLYDYQKAHPEFIERKQALKQSPILKARETIIKSLENPQTAAWYLERKKKDEFTSKQEIEHNINTELDEMREELSKTIKYVKTGTAQTDTGGASVINTPA